MKKHTYYERTIIVIKKIFNTFLTPRYYKFYINIKKNINNKNKFFNLLSRLWFVPSVNDLKYWRNVKSTDNRHGIVHYSKFSTGSKDLIAKIKKYSKKDSKILDLCCNVGRYLNFLNSKGYKNLYGVDINKDAISIAKKNMRLNLTCSPIENYLLKQKNNYFDITYTHGATIELIKPTFNLVSEITRITKLYVIILISEIYHYPRFWRYEFQKNNFNIIDIKILNNTSKDFRSLIIFKKNKLCT
jgi:SAM-dependent methyltransferase